VERERELVRGEEGIESLDDSAAVAGVRRRILWEVRCRSEWLPGCVGHRIRVVVHVRQMDRLVGAPEPEVVLGVEAGDHRVGAGAVRIASIRAVCARLSLRAAATRSMPSFHRLMSWSVQNRASPVCSGVLLVLSIRPRSFTWLKSSAYSWLVRELGP